MMNKIKTLCLGLLFLITLSLNAQADRIGFIVSEVDGDPDQYVLGLILPNGTVSITGNDARYIPAGGGGGDLLADGSVPLTANWDVGAYTITGTQFISDIAIGTAPFVVTSTTVVSNLNADLLDGESASAFEDADAAITKSDEAETITANWVNTANPWADNEVADDITLTNLSQITTKPITGLSATNWRIFYSADGGVPVELALGADGTYLKSNGAAVAPSFEAPSGSGDITSVLDDLTGDVPVLYQAWTAFTAADATPDVSAKTLWRTVDTTTITDFDGIPVDGQWLIIYCGAATVFDLTSSGITAANRSSDYTATVGDILLFFYRDTQWYASNMPEDVNTATIGKYESGTEMDFHGTILNPQGVYDNDSTNHAITIVVDVPAAFTITALRIACDADPATEQTITFYHKATGVGYGTPTTIEAVTTTAGIANITTGIDDADIPADRKIFIVLSDPDDALTEIAWQIEGDWD